MWVRHLSSGLVRVLAEPAGEHPSNTSAPSGVSCRRMRSGYDRLFSAEREGGALTEVGAAHARRKSTMYTSKSATAEEAPANQ
ncbi:hypothetical protein BANRA_05760 [Escherichia coli]|nr:hypothetical protein BANRA_05760 [Escherichia coli]